jgi:methionine-rich copper-binding protein CopC
MRIKALLIGILIAGGLLFTETAHAHSAYVRSNPGADAVIATSPAKVDIWFSQELFRRKGENVIHVSGPDGHEVSTGETQIDDDDRKHIWVELNPNLPAGKYLVEWKNISVEDGHSTEGSFSFSIDPQAAVTSAPMQASTDIPTLTNNPLPESTPQPAPTEAPVSKNTPCAGGLAPAAGLVFFDILRRRRKQTDP